MTPLRDQSGGRRWLPVAAMLAALCGAGCEDLSEFRASGDEVFHGVVVGSESEAGESDTAPFILRGFESQTELDLRFDPEVANAGTRVDDDQQEIRSPGALRTYICPAKEHFCDEPARIGAFDWTPLKAIQGLAHDALGQYDFPGGGRIRNYMFGAHFSSQLDDVEIPRNAVVFISLMDNGKIELRVLAPELLDAEGEELAPGLFGVFSLERRSR